MDSAFYHGRHGDRRAPGDVGRGDECRAKEALASADVEAGGDGDPRRSGCQGEGFTSAAEIFYASRRAGTYSEARPPFERFLMLMHTTSRDRGQARRCIKTLKVALDLVMVSDQELTFGLASKLWPHRVNADCCAPASQGGARRLHHR